MRILVDMDGVIADWGAEWDRHCDAHGALAAALPRHRDQNSFNLMEGRTQEERDIIRIIFNEPNFYDDLNSIRGSRDALRGMLAMGHDVRIVTTPWFSNPTSASGKIAWVRRRYGHHWAERMILTADKTLVRGDILIDDKPEVRGIEVPEWEHVWFTQPYNRELTGKRRINSWDEWEEMFNVL